MVNFKSGATGIFPEEFDQILNCFDELLYFYIVCCYMCFCSTFMFKTEAISCGLIKKLPSA